MTDSPIVHRRVDGYLHLEWHGPDRALIEREVLEELIRDLNAARGLSIDPPCPCAECRDAADREAGRMFTTPMTMMILCPECGNKRCPRAGSHRWACNHSNEPDQPRYPAPLPSPPVN